MQSAQSAQGQDKPARRLTMLLRDYSVLIGWVVVCIVFNTMKPTFMTANNWGNILREMSVISVVAMGLTLVRSAGRLDLSLAGTMSLSALTAAAVLDTARYGNALAVCVAIAFSALFGLINGLLVGYAGLNQVVVTLGSSFVATGISSLYRGGRFIWMTGPQGDGLRWFNSGTLLGLPFILVVAIVIVVLVYFLLQRSLFGRRIYAVGNSPLAAMYSAIDVRLVTLGTYVVSSSLAGLAGVLALSRAGVASPELGQAYFLPVISAVFIGANMFRGLPSVWGTIFGVLIMSTVLNGVAMLNLTYGVQQFSLGTIMLFCVGIAVSQRGSLRER